jgi:phenylacetic acid degradation operon negative regulatory protein
MAEFGIIERLVRTSVFRLARDGWLESRLVGRRSYYSLTVEGRERFEQATHRIYGEPVGRWDERWCLVLLSALDTPTRELVRKECAWLGFGPMSANVLAHPTPDLVDLDVTLHRLGVEDSVIVLRGQTIRGDGAMRELAISCWNLADIDARYAGFVRRFRPVYKALSSTTRIPGKAAFLIRTLLIQEYRKVLLRDPWLPPELLPPSWHGGAAYQLCRNIYRATHGPADAYLDASMETADGPLPPPSRAFWQRFGGLEKTGKVEHG